MPDGVPDRPDQNCEPTLGDRLATDTVPVSLYRSRTLAARGYLYRGSRLFLVVFDPMGNHDELSLDRPAFAERFLGDNGYHAVHILSASNNWFQDRGPPELLRRVREALHGYARIVAYGSSMGAYGALRFADRIRADVVIAISPQYTANDGATFEVRWPVFRSGLTWLHEYPHQRLPHLAEVTVIHNGWDCDRHHARLIKRDLPHAHFVAIPLAGHPAGVRLAEMGLLSRAVLDAAHGRLDADALRRASAIFPNRSACSPSPSFSPCHESV